ncbi:MAG: MTH1187 family thiamine-binding protein [Pseudomonadota bacterium]
MMAEFAIVPLSKEHLSGAVALALEEIKKCQVHYQLGPMGTSLEGPSDQVFLALRKCYEKLSHSNSRILMTITLDSRKTDSTTLSEMVRSVESCF